MPFPTITVTPGTGTTINTLPNAGQALAADSLPVVLTAIQLAALTPLATVGVTGTFFQATQPVSLAGAVALAAGSAAVGSVTVSNFPATQPVSNASLPLPAGASTEATLAALSAKVTAVNTGAVTIAAALPAGANVVGKAGIDQTTPGTTNAVQTVAGASGGCTPSHRVSTADTNSFVLKGSAGHVYGYQFANQNAAPRYVKFFNKATAAVLGTDVPVKTVCVPGGTPAQPTVVTLGQPVGLAFVTGIAIAITANLADADATAITAGDLLCEVDFK